MKVKVLVSVAGVDFSYAPDEVVVMPQERAKEFIKAGFVEEVKPKINNRKK